MDNRSTIDAVTDSACMSLAARLVRRHRVRSGTVLLAVVDDTDVVRDTAAIATDDTSSRLDDVDLALIVRVLAESLDLRRREVLTMCVVLCRDGDPAWQPEDLRWRQTSASEAEVRGVRMGTAILVTEEGWRDDRGFGGHRPRLVRQEMSPWA